MPHAMNPFKPAPWPMTPLLVPPDARPLWRDLALAWPLWASGASQIEDVSGNGLHGVLSAGVDPESEWTAGEVGAGLLFHGYTTELLTVADPPGDRLDNTSALTVEIMFQGATLSGFRGLAGKYKAVTGARSWRLYYEAGEIELQVSSDGANYEDHITSGLALADDIVHQIVATFDAGEFHVYRNGVEAANSGDFTVQTSIYGGSEAFVVGQRVDTDGSYLHSFRGEIYSVRVWKRALGAEEVRYLAAYPWAMYRPGSPFPSLALEHGSAAQAAGPWSAGVEIAAGVQSYLIPGLVNGTEYDVQAFTVDESGNESSGSSIVQGTPASSEPWRGVRSPLIGRPTTPRWLRRLR